MSLEAPGLHRPSHAPITPAMIRLAPGDLRFSVAPMMDGSNDWNMDYFQKRRRYLF